MNWEEIGAIGQVLGSIAVFVTLVYLAIQTSHARQEARRSAFQEHHDGLRDLALVRATNKRLNQARFNAQAALSAAPNPFVEALVMRGITRDDANILLLDLAAEWLVRTPFIQNVNQMTAEEREIFEGPLRYSYSIDPLGRVWWETTKNWNPRSVVRYVDNVLAQPG